MSIKKRTWWHKVGRTDLWWEYFVWGQQLKSFGRKISDQGKLYFFKSCITPPTLYISPNSDSSNRRALCANKKVVMTLYYLNDCGALSMAVNSFRIATNIALAVINKVYNAIVLYVGPKYLHLPKTNQEMREKISVFETKFGMIQPFGYIDDTHIPTACSSEHSHYYFCYKQFNLLDRTNTKPQ